VPPRAPQRGAARQLQCRVGAALRELRQPLPSVRSVVLVVIIVATVPVAGTAVAEHACCALLLICRLVVVNVHAAAATRSGRSGWAVEAHHTRPCSAAAAAAG
jgi:hypothetical protein